MVICFCIDFKPAKFLIWNLCSDVGLLAMAISSDCRRFLPIPILNILTPDLWSRLASEIVNLELLDIPSVITIAILGTPFRSPYLLLNDQRRNVLRARYVLVPPRLYLIALIALIILLLSPYLLRWNRINGNELNVTTPTRIFCLPIFKILTISTTNRLTFKKFFLVTLPDSSSRKTMSATAFLHAVKWKRVYFLYLKSQIRRWKIILYTWIVNDLIVEKSTGIKW